MSIFENLRATILCVGMIYPSGRIATPRPAATNATAHTDKKREISYRQMYYILYYSYKNTIVNLKIDFLKYP